MDKSSFSSNLAHNGEFSLEDKLEIMGEKNRYPYCAPLQMLDLLSDKAVALYHWEDIYKPGVMLHVPEPQVVESLLEQVKPTVVDSASDKQLFEKNILEMEDIAIDAVKALGSTRNPDLLDECTAGIYHLAAARWNGIEEQLWMKHGRGF